MRFSETELSSRTARHRARFTVLFSTRLSEQGPSSRREPQGAAPGTRRCSRRGSAKPRQRGNRVLIVCVRVVADDGARLGDEVVGVEVDVEAVAEGVVHALLVLLSCVRAVVVDG